MKNEKVTINVKILWNMMCEDCEGPVLFLNYEEGEWLFYCVNPECENHESSIVREMPNRLTSEAAPKWMEKRDSDEMDQILNELLEEVDHDENSF